MRMICIRNVIFNKTRFYNFAKIDLSHLLIIIMKNIVKILKISNNIFFEVVIQKINNCDKYINHLKNKSIEKKVEQFHKSKNFQIDLKDFFLLTFKMISKLNQTIFSLNTINTINLNTERESFKLFVDQNNVQKTMNK